MDPNMGINNRLLLDLQDISENAAALGEMKFANPEEEYAATMNLIRWNYVKIRSINAKTRAVKKRETNCLDIDESIALNEKLLTLFGDKLALLKEITWLSGSVLLQWKFSLGERGAKMLEHMTGGPAKIPERLYTHRYNQAMHLQWHGDGTHAFRERIDSPSVPDLGP
jgi:hypothetical protein